MTEHPAPAATPVPRRGWLWLLPLTLAATLICALAIFILLMGNAASLFAGGGFLDRQDTLPLLTPIPGTLITWVGLPLALLRPHARTGAVVTVAGGLAVGLPLLAESVHPLVLLFWATLLLALPALRTPSLAR